MHCCLEWKRCRRSKGFPGISTIFQRQVCPHSKVNWSCFICRSCFVNKLFRQISSLASTKWKRRDWLLATQVCSECKYSFSSHESCSSLYWSTGRDEVQAEENADFPHRWMSDGRCSYYLTLWLEFGGHLQMLAKLFWGGQSRGPRMEFSSDCWVFLLPHNWREVHIVCKG